MWEQNSRVGLPTEVQVQVHVDSGVGDLELVFNPPPPFPQALPFLDLSNPAEGIIKSIRNFVHQAVLIRHSPGLEVFELQLGHKGRGA